MRFKKPKTYVIVIEKLKSKEKTPSSKIENVLKEQTRTWIEMAPQNRTNNWYNKRLTTAQLDSARCWSSN
jgi:hypothetical protein